MCGDADSVNADDMSLFPAEQPQIVNRFINHNELLYDEGYNSEGNLYFLGEGMYNKYENEKTIGRTTDVTAAVHQAREAEVASSPVPVGPWSHEKFMEFWVS